MEFGLREWMILIGGLLIAAVVVDGVRRVFSDRRNVIRMGMSHQSDATEADDLHNPELPNGTARVIPRSAAQAPVGRASDVRATRRDPLLEKSRPVAARPAVSQPARQDPDPVADPADTLHIPEAVQPESVQPEARQPAPVQAKTVPPEAGQPAPVQAKTVPPEPVQPDPEPIPEPIVETPVVQVAKAAPPARKPAEPKRPAPPPPAEKPAPIEAQMSSETLNTQPDEVLIINILSRDKNGFNGADLLEVLLACDVRFGSMDIFHRYEGAQGKGRIQFSVANLVKPGTFDLDNIKEFYTPGVCMFLQLPGPKEPLAAFDCMAEIANCIVKNLQGEMRDEAHSVLTGQTIEHYRERIRDYERKRLMRAAHRSA